jgi:DNA-binding transcriptional LysR family regulator
MNLNQLKIFYTAVKEGNLSAAAELLFITQPAVTKSIQRLQEHYELKFIDYVGRKLVLTDAGQALYKIAENIFEMENYAEESIKDFKERKRGHIRILASESFGDYYLPEVVIPFCKAHPLVQVSMNILPTELVVENTAGLKCDVGFISYAVRHEKLTVREVLEDELVIITSKRHPLKGKHVLRPNDLEGQSMIMHEEGSAPRRAIDDFLQRHGITIKIPMELTRSGARPRDCPGLTQGGPGGNRAAAARRAVPRRQHHEAQILPRPSQGQVHLRVPAAADGHGLQVGG